MIENEITVVSPESLEILHTYLRNGSDTEKTAMELGLPVETVVAQLEKKESQRYLDRIFNESGFRNRDKMAAVWDAILATKLEELEETGMGSSKDIVEIMEKMHKFAMDQMKMQIELEKARSGGEGPRIQVNQQNNYGGDNYNTLLEKILGENS